MSFAGDEVEPYPYILLPHFPGIEMAGQSFNELGIVDDGLLMKGSHLRVVNASDTGLFYDASFQQLVPSLRTYLSDFSPSTDVIGAARASAYVDIFSGTISAFKDKCDIRVQAIIETDGAPVLRITPMTADDPSVPTVAFTLDSPETLFVGNVSPFCLDGCDFDFLLHYLTDTSGIPRLLTAPAPGMPGGPVCIDDASQVDRKPNHHPDPVKSLETLIEMGFPRRVVSPMRFETSASCSDSRYP